MLNVVCLVGHLGADPEIRYTQSGQAWGNVNLAVNDGYTDSAGQRVQKTYWVRLVFFGKTAEIASQYAHKGSRVGITGKFTTREWEDQNTGQKRSTVEIVVQNLELLGTPNGNNEQNRNDGDYGQPRQQAPNQRQNPPPQNRQSTGPPPNQDRQPYDPDDDIPF